MSEDRIEREITIDAPVDRVWAVITEPELISAWFSQAGPAEIDLRPGGVMRVDHGRYGVFPTKIVRVDPPRFLSYRWASAYPGEEATEDNSTLVEFSLAPSAGGTLLRVVESGFDRLDLPADKEPTAGYQSHSHGWVDCLGGLLKVAEAGAA
jgi:uncharacterized protein YndB with AHSA1/START domain